MDAESLIPEHGMFTLPKRMGPYWKLKKNLQSTDGGMLFLSNTIEEL